MSDYGRPLNSFEQLRNIDDEDLIARTIYSEAQGESYEGKVAVFYVIVNRLILGISEFGQTYKEICLHPVNRFDGVRTSYALRPNTSSQAWKDSVAIATGQSYMDNPVGKSLWFNRNDVFKRKSRLNYDEGLQYSFDGRNYTNVVENYEIGKQTFFRIAGSRYEF